MWHNLVGLNIPALNLVVRAVVVYLVLLILLRISGKRQLGQMNATEFVVILLISNAVQNSMNGGDNSLLGGLILAVVLVLVSTCISILTYRSRFFDRLIEGVPTLLVHKGVIIMPNMKKERLTNSELRMLLRKQGIHDILEIESAILEADGSISVMRTVDQPWSG